MMAQVIQVEIRTGTTHTLTWLDSALKLKPGMALVCKGDPRPWSVVHTYLTTVQVKDTSIEWKVDNCRAAKREASTDADPIPMTRSV
jgi:hypothetical protein